MEISKRYYWHLFISISCSLSNKLNLPSFISRELKTSLKSGLTISKVDVYIRAIFFLHPTIFNHLHGLFNAWDWVGWRRQWCFNTCGDLLCCSFYLRTCALVQLKEWTLLILLLSSSRDFFMLPLFFFLILISSKHPTLPHPHPHHLTHQRKHHLDMLQSHH